MYDAKGFCVYNIFIFFLGLIYCVWFLPMSINLILNFIKNNNATIISLVISLVAVIVSFGLYSISNTDLQLKYRPYLVIADNTMLYDEKLILVNSPYVMLLKVYNAPAKIVSQEYNYYKLDKQNNKTLLKEFPSTNTEFVYPFSNSEGQYNRGIIEKIEFNNYVNGCVLGEKLIREVKISYNWLSSGNEKLYTFEGKWIFNTSTLTWIAQGINAT